MPVKSSDPGLLQTPVLFLVFNRPKATQAVLNEIRAAKPQRLYVAADGPRLDKQEELPKVEQVREVIQNGVDWSCEVVSLIREQNLGCRQAVSSAIDWFFEHEEEGIILEDDCLPDLTFFRYCEELLGKYRSDSRIMMVSGNSFQTGSKRTDYSYYFSRYTHIWGWATWRRAWRLYDESMQIWPELQEGAWLKDMFRGDEYAVAYWEKIFNAVKEGKIDTWDYQWMLTNWSQNGLSIIPNRNLVSNIGFGTEATHTRTKGAQLANLPTEPMVFPLKHPPFVIRDSIADEFTEKQVFKHSSLVLSFRQSLARLTS